MVCGSCRRVRVRESRVVPAPECDVRIGYALGKAVYFMGAAVLTVGVIMMK